MTFMSFKKILFFSAITFYAMACGNAQQNQNSDPSEHIATNIQGSVKYKQYMVEGRRLYTQYCSNCHQPDGGGLGKVYPPINKSDFIDNNFEESICIIKNGRQGEITVNGITYNQPMMPIPGLTDLEIAEISTFIYNNWGRDKGLIPVKGVQDILSKCTNK